jgi:hypothetical protein
VVGCDNIWLAILDLLPGEKVDVSKEEVTIVGFVLSQIGIVFGVGKAYGRLSSKVLRHDDELKTLREAFVTGDGEPRIVTYQAHDKMQAACHNVQEERQLTINRRLDGHDIKLDAILNAVSDLKAQIKAK